MRYLLLLFALLPSPVFALDKEEVRKAFAFERGETVVRSSVKDVFAFERMKARSDYPNDLSKATKEGQLFVLWADYEDASLYGWFLETYPDAIHSFCKDADTQKGITLGKMNAGKVREVDVIASVTPNIKEVILKASPSQRAPRPFLGDTRVTIAPDRFGTGPNMSGAVVSSPPLLDTAPANYTRMAPVRYAGQFGNMASNCTVH